jgi:hypothetical protein
MLASLFALDTGYSQQLPTDSARALQILQYDNLSELLGIQSRLYWIPRARQPLSLVLNHSMQDLDKDRSFTAVETELSARINYTFRF